MARCPCRRGGTPGERNRYVDFLRAASIVAVVLGHWLIAAPVIREGEILGITMLAAAPWTQTLTWLFQVMPIFFVVGGYSNAASWRSATARDTGYTSWLTQRLRRLVIPVVPVVVAWSVFSVVGRALGLSGSLLRLGSPVALIPLWFLAVYVLVVAMTPLTLRLWDRHGLASFAALSAAAIVIDVVRFATHADVVGWTNFVVVWAAVHQLGYAWRDGRFAVASRSFGAGLAGLLLLVALVVVGPYPMSMVGVPGAEASNNSPPTIALIALGVAQAGFLLAAESRATRWLSGTRPWAATIAVNGSIMTLYLWHLTAMVAVVGVSLLILDGWGMALEPASPVWWLGRPVWIGILTLATLPFLGWFSRFERPGPSKSVGTFAAFAAAGLACVGLTNIAGGGIADASNWLRTEAVVPVFAAAILLRGRIALGR